MWEGGRRMGAPQRQDNTEGGQRSRGERCGRGDNIRGTPQRVGQHVVSSVSSPLARVIPPPVWYLPGGWDNMWCPPCHPPSPASSPSSVVSPRRVGQHVVSPCIVPPHPRRPPSSVVSPRRVGQHVVSPCVIPPRNLARYVVPPLLQMRFQAKKTSNLKSRAAEIALLIKSKLSI